MRLSIMKLQTSLPTIGKCQLPPETTNTTTTMYISSCNDNDSDHPMSPLQQLSMRSTDSERKQNSDHHHHLADTLLSSIHDWYIVTKSNHTIRSVPTFQRMGEQHKQNEIIIGKVLGTGGFGIVYEITQFNIIVNEQTSDNEDEENNTSQQEHSLLDAQPVDDSVDNCHIVRSEDKPQQQQSLQSNGFHPDYADLHVHYDVHTAKQYMQQNCCTRDENDHLNRNTNSNNSNATDGTARYALKRLQIGLTKVERERGMIDLAMEAQYLSTVWHPNIIKIRGIADGPMIDKGFFIIIDRLYGTLDGKMNEWRLIEKKHDHSKLVRSIFGRSLSQDKIILEELLLERLLVAYDLANGYSYLHEHQLVYRDIKPTNIGFDHRGDVKIFDFGLCKSLSPSLKVNACSDDIEKEDHDTDENIFYRLTGQAGSIPYMAPEVVVNHPYNTKCDVYSFALLLWEMISLQETSKYYNTPEKFIDRIILHHERFPIKKSWPTCIRSILPNAWDHDPIKRPSMKSIAAVIRNDLNSMSNDDSILNRTFHMINRSRHGQQQRIE